MVSSIIASSQMGTSKSDKDEKYNCREEWDGTVVLVDQE